jgi:hypothetical protein
MHHLGLVPSPHLSTSLARPSLTCQVQMALGVLEVAWLHVIGDCNQQELAPVLETVIAYKLDNVK